MVDIGWLVEREREREREREGERCGGDDVNTAYDMQEVNVD